MKTYFFPIAIIYLTFLTSCTKETSEASYNMESNQNTLSGTQKPQAGTVTAGEWNDLDNWEFWTNLLQKQGVGDACEKWGFHLNSRISVKLKDNNNKPVTNAEVILQNSSEQIIWKSRTDNFGVAELWPGIASQQEQDLTNLRIEVVTPSGSVFINQIKSFEEGVNEITLSAGTNVENMAQVSFVVDATGSMGDEMEYLKAELKDVIQRVKADNLNVKIQTSSVFYRDKHDAYLTRVSPFTEDINVTQNFINGQSAKGGGDIPEAVEKALEETMALQWNTTAREKIIFLLLDAPPHDENQVLLSYHESVAAAANMGIKIIPITASGIDQSTEFLMRLTAMSTNGTYVFITDDSGVGNDHLEPTVGQYEVEFLNDLMVRLLDKYLQ